MSGDSPLLGSIGMFAGNFAPRGWALCQGQILPIDQNQALFSIIGTTYGGDGRRTFALPDLRGRVPVGAGQGPGLSNNQLGQRGGHETTTLTVANLPAHNHHMQLGKGKGDQANGNTRYLATLIGDDDDASAGDHAYTDTAPAGLTMATSAITNTGGGQSFGIVQPFLVLNYCICLQGLYPSRS